MSRAPHQSREGSDRGCCSRRAGASSPPIELNERLADEALDVTLPGAARSGGGIHPVMRTWQPRRGDIRFDRLRCGRRAGDRDRLVQLHRAEQAGESSGPVDAGHVLCRRAGRRGRPLLLRTHTSPMQVRYARMHKPPIKVIAPGRTYRVDSDATHSPMFHQVEGLWIDEHISFADLKACLHGFPAQLLRDRRTAGAFPAVVLSVHRAVG